jgi:uncharacterized membrane protein
MREVSQSGRPAAGFNRELVLWADRRILWLSKHWLAVVNAFFLLYVALPVLAPFLLAAGFTGAANTIYTMYQVACHQLPSRSYFIGGEQVAFCERDVAIYGSIFLAGVAFYFVRQRLQPLPLRWYVFFLVPVALDGGMQMTSTLLEVVPITVLWAVGLIALGLVSAVLNRQRYLTWHSYLFFAFGPLALLYLQFFGPHLSNWLLRSITGFIFAVGTVWFTYPYMETSFKEMEQELRLKLARAQAGGNKAAGSSA